MMLLCLGPAIVLGLLMLAARPLLRWYFGINQVIESLENIDASLRCLPAVREARARARKVA